MSISERLKELADFEGSQTNLAKKTGLKSQVISRIINQGSGIHSDTLIAIAESYPNLSMEWFITGKGEMWKPDVPAVRETPMTDQEKDAMKDEMIGLLKFQVNTMKKAILEKAPELAKYLNIDETKD